MRSDGCLLSGFTSTVVIAVVYVLCHGLTAWVFSPIQSYFLSEITIFASLVYLPHGVRVLSTWLIGARAIIPLILGAVASELIFTQPQTWERMQHILWLSLVVSAVSAYVAFRLMHVFGASVWNCNRRRMNWRQLLVVGLLASVVNSVGQTVAFSGVIAPNLLLGVVVTYAAGDMIGQCVAMFVLMMIFRALRLRQQPKRLET
ncbi:hypothetical protein [Phaeobacter sp. HF9A]|uniref:hypothetical protein n=1 Tax=Phaeobacter sp. HF9A TaxID=2721561 RepID=UPI0014308785|nr:hypothetical protein [Phaeobacter sp. HF9A]NIZ14845.1 hypothetical protein [Phaeobacter sp. HF9A]